jgi:hypothetical protein
MAHHPVVVGDEVPRTRDAGRRLAPCNPAVNRTAQVQAGIVPPHAYEVEQPESAVLHVQQRYAHDIFGGMFAVVMVFRPEQDYIVRPAIAAVP